MSIRTYRPILRKVGGVIRMLMRLPRYQTPRTQLQTPPRHCVQKRADESFVDAAVVVAGSGDWMREMSQRVPRAHAGRLALPH